MVENSPSTSWPSPYFAAIFTSQRTGDDEPGYQAMAARMEQLARQQPGFLGVEHAHSPDGQGITVSYWASRAALAAWREEIEHRAAQALGRQRWYASYRLRVAVVERESYFP
jgi:heme-degrading monooxygenase HmoA